MFSEAVKCLFTAVKLNDDWLSNTQVLIFKCIVFQYDRECTSILLSIKYFWGYEVCDRNPFVWINFPYLWNKFSSCLICAYTQVLCNCPLRRLWECLFKWQQWTSITETVHWESREKPWLIYYAGYSSNGYLREKKLHFAQNFVIFHGPISNYSKDKSEFIWIHSELQWYKSHIPPCPLLLGFLLTYRTGMHCDGLVNFPTLAPLLCLWFPVLLGYLSLIRQCSFHLFFILLFKK